MKQMLIDADIKRLMQMIEGSSRIVLTCHVRPDGDALGSSMGMAWLLKSLGKDARVIVPDQPPKTLSFMPGFKDLAIFTRHDPYCQRLVSEAELIICCDFNKPSRQDQLEPLIQNATCTKVLIDHHEDPDYFADLTFSYPEMSSTCELVFRIIAAMGLYPELSHDAAECILTGIITDTRNFTVNVNELDLYEILMRLLEKGVDKNRIVKLALNTCSLSSLKIQAYAISECMEVVEKHRCAIITLNQETLKHFHYEKGDTEGLVNEPLKVRSIISSFFLREDPEFIRISARSEEDFPVSKVCEDLFGGGGHLQAAGGEFYGTLEECKAKLIAALPNYDKYLPDNNG
ncbi:MAG: bifunctional oligoribonuclease/PAP phosphatase NrnA [Muribaculaceae bacterium]|nr:bifunctional oligoribonuclease/PAP phosphatase NrnA [Muribaculaceae bacterium]